MTIKNLKPEVLLITEYIPHYRIPIYTLLALEVNLTIIHSQIELKFSRFKFTKEIEHKKQYILSEIDWGLYTNDLVPFEGLNSFDRNGFLEILKKYLDSAQIASDWEVLKKAKEEVLVNSLSMLCPFEPEEKQVLLEADTIRNRLEVLVTLMKLS